jgi:hypothetical protein
VVNKTKENNQKVGKIIQTLNQMPTPGPKHDKIRTQWVSNILSKKGMIVDML